MDPLVELPHLLALEGVRQAEHRRAMGDLGEGVGGWTTDPLRRGVRRDQLGELRFQLDQLTEQRVVFRVGDLRVIEHVVLAVGAVDEFAQLEDARLRFLDILDGGAHTFTIGARLTARIFIPTRSNFTMISSSVRVIVLFSTVPRPQDRCST